jgi:hypothetical protein
VKVQHTVFFAILITLLLGGQTPTTVQQGNLQHEIAMLNERGVTYRMLAGNQLEVTDPRSEQRWVFDADRLLSPRKPTYDTIPTLTVDLRTIDTNLYNWKFHYVNSVPLTDGWGYPMDVSDFDRNGKPEAYGGQQTQSAITNRVYELNESAAWVLRHVYSERLGSSNKSGDLDGNGLREIYWGYGDSLLVYEQLGPDSLPTRSKFRHRQWYQSATGIPNEVSDMTRDGRPEILYRGSRPDTLSPPNIEKTFIMTYDSLTNNLREVWSAQLPPDCYEELCSGAIAAGDFDSDGKKEFVTSNFAGNVYVVEHVVGDSFAVTWSTNLSAAGRAAAGDVDGNGVTEFFVGGTQAEADGYVHLRAYPFERTSDNTYQPTFAFNIFPAGIFFVDLYQTADVDGDGVPELLLSFAGGIAIIKGAGEHSYQMFYHKFVSSLDGVAAWKICSNQSAHLFVSRSIYSQPIFSQTDVYRLDSALVAAVDGEDQLPSAVTLLTGYPNPFNPQTTVTYDINKHGHVTLKVFDIVGKEVVTLVDEMQDAGKYSAVWNPGEKGVASGIYLVRLTFNNQSLVGKLVYLK